MRIFITSLIIVSSFLTVQSQSKRDCYERLSNLAKLKLNQGKSDTALIIYKEAFSLIPEESKNKFHYFSFAQYFLANDIIDSSACYLEKALRSGYDSSYILKNEKFTSIVESSYWENIKNIKPTLDNFNWKYYNTIIEMVGVDQAIRDENRLRNWANDSIYHLVDSINLYTLKRLISKYGLPSVSSQGFHFNEIMILLMHASMYSEVMFDEVLKILYKANEEYLIDKGFIAIFIDRRLIWHNKEKQMIGTWNYSKVFNSINDLKVVDSLRFTFNLLNLHDYSKLTNLELPQNYVKSDYPSGYFCK